VTPVSPAVVSRGGGGIIRLVANEAIKIESRWPVLVALAAVVALHFSLPDVLSLGPRWLLVFTFVVLAAIVSILNFRHAYDQAHLVGFVLMGAITAAVIVSLGLLIKAFLQHSIQPVHLLRSAASLWGSNVLLFGAWYWKLDAGGPYQRAQRERHEEGAFLFPQMALHEKSPAKPENWRPNFVDYLFLSFNTSTALSPTDTQILSRWAKVLMMLQSLISMTTIVLLAARAVNIL